MYGAPDPDWYFEHVLAYVDPWEDAVRLGPARSWLAWWAAQAGQPGDTAQLRAASQGFVMTVDELNRLGWQRHDHRRVLRRGEWTTVRHGVRTSVQIGSESARIDDESERLSNRSVVPVDTSGAAAGGSAFSSGFAASESVHVIARRKHALAASAAALVRRGHRVSGRSAAILYGLPTCTVPETPELTAPALTLGSRSGAHVYGAGLQINEVTEWHGVAVTTIERTLVDLGRHDRDDAVMAADVALREGLTTRDDLTAQIERSAGWPGICQAREVLSITDAAAESPLESLARLRLRDDGFPTPRLQFDIRHPRRRYPDRVDFLLVDTGVIIEADGRGKYTDDELWREKQRESRLRSLGFRVERVLWSDLFGGWPDTSRRLRQTMREQQDRRARLPRRDGPFCDA